MDVPQHTFHMVIVAMLAILLGLWVWGYTRGSAATAAGPVMMHSYALPTPPTPAFMMRGARASSHDADSVPAMVERRTGAALAPLQPFPDAPRGANPNTWPQMAEADGTVRPAPGTTMPFAMPAGVKGGRQGVMDAYRNSQRSLASRGQRTVAGEARKHRKNTLGHRGGVTMDLLREMLGEGDHNPLAAPTIDCEKFLHGRVLHVTPDHPCFDFTHEGRTLQAEEDARNAQRGITGSAYGTMNTRK